MFKILKKIINIKLIFTKPNKKKFLIYDRVGFEFGGRFFNLFFSEKQYEILDVRYETINIYVILFTLIKFGIKNFKDNYKKCFIDIVSPTIVFTCIDNNPAFYNLKNINSKPYYVSFQNGMRDGEFYRACQLQIKKTKQKLKCDHIFVFAENEKKRLSKFIKANIHPVGNAVNNNYYKKKQFINKVKSIMYVARFKVEQENLDEDIKIFNLLINFCKKRKVKLSFGSKLGVDKEIFFRENLNKGNWTYLPRIRIDPSNAYKNLYKHQMIVFTNSTLGFEALARGIKCVALCKDFPTKGNYKKYPKSGAFWTNSKKQHEIEKTLNRVMNFSSKNWSRIAHKYSSEIMKYDPDNYKINKILQSLLKKNN